MNLGEVRQLVYKLCEQKSVDVTEKHIEQLYRFLGGIPLAIVWSIGQYRRPSLAIDRFLKRLRQVRLTGAVEEQERQLLEFCFREAYETLGPRSKEMLKVLGLFSIPLSETDLRAILELNPVDFWNAWEELDAFSLIQTQEDEQSNECFSVLPLTRLFVRSELFRSEQDVQFVKDMCYRYAEHLVASSASEICVFTPDYRPVRLPKGATPLDFAYYLHTEVGHRFESANVNSRAAAISHSLQNGDIVEIITNKYRSGPDEQWLYHVRTKKAQRSIKAWFRRPKRARRAIRRGNAFSLQCDMSRAEAAYIEAMEIDPKSTWAYNRLGHLARLKRNYTKALRLYKTALSLEPDNAFAFEGIACVHYQRGDIENAAELYAKALEIKPNYANALFGLGRCYCILGQYHAADDVFNRALDISTPMRRKAILHLFRMISQLGLGNSDVAVFTYLDNALREFRKMVPSHRLNDLPYYGPHVLYYYSIPDVQVFSRQ